MFPFAEIIAELLIFGAVVLVTVAIMREAERIFEQRRRLGAQTVAGGGATAPGLLTKGASENAFFRWVQVSTSISDPDERNQLRQALMLAGFSSPNAAIWYVIARFSLAILLPGLFVLSQFLSAKPETGLGVVIWPLVLCAVGLYAQGVRTL